MAEGKNRNLSGDYTDSHNFDDYSPENQQYLRDHSQSTVDGVPIDNVDNKEDGFFGSFRKRKDSEGNTKWGIGRDDLKDAEASASKDPNASGRGGDKSASLGEKEKNVEGDNTSGSKFKNAVKGAEALKSGNVVKAAGILKKAGPLGAILALILTFAGVSFLGQMAMPFSFMSVLQGNFDSISTSNISRTSYLLGWQLKPNTRTVSNEADTFVRSHSKIYQKFTGASEKYFSISKRQARKFANAGIDIQTDVDTGEKVMVFKGANGESMTVTAENFKETLKANSEFNDAFEKGTMTFRKSVANWFNSKAKAFLERINILRNRFNDYDAGQDATKNKEDFEATVKNATGDADVDGKTGDRVLNETETEADEDGNTDVIHSVDSDPDGTNELKIKRGATAAEVETSLRSFSEGVGGKISKVASKLAQGACTVSEIVGAINMLVIASEAAQILQVSSTVFEGIQKAQVEGGSGTPIHEIGNSLTQVRKTSYQINGGETVEKEGSAMSAAAVSALYGNTAVNTSDPSVNSFNLTDSINSIMNAIGGGMEAYKACTIAKIGAGVIEVGLDTLDSAADVAAIVACVAGAVETVGISCGPLILKMGLKFSAGMAASIAIATIISTVVSGLVPKVTTMMARDLATNIGGEDFGNAIVSGANMYMGQNHQYGGGALASRSALVTQFKHQEEYMAEQARYDRQNRSPFDASSQYTFLGSLLAKSIPLLTQTSSITGGITNLSNIVSSSFSSLMPHASAVQSAVTAQAAADNTQTRCPELDSIGAVGDSFCNPYFSTDYSTMNIDPAEVTYKIATEWSGGNNFDLSNDGEETPTINESLEDSRLYKYIIFCGQRSATTFGKADQNIANTINSGANSLESSIPIWGGVADVIQGADLVSNMGYISGEACVIDNSGEGLGTTDKVFTWDEAKYYQRFIEDQSLAENMGLVEESSVSVALRHYYEQNPIDDSYEGILAYYSGMTKEKVADTLEIIDVLAWIAGYDPSDLYPYHYNQIEIADEEDSDSYNVAINIYYITPKTAYITYRREYTIG